MATTTVGELDSGDLCRRREDANGVYFEIHPQKTATWAHRWSQPQRTPKLSGREVYWLARIRKNPDLVAAFRKTRYKDSEKRGSEAAYLVFLDPEMSVRTLKRPPPYPDKYPCKCCQGKHDEEDQMVRKQKPPEPDVDEKKRPPEKKGVEKPEGYPACCAYLHQVGDVVASEHMCLIDVDPFLDENQSVNWGYAGGGPAVPYDRPNTGQPLGRTIAALMRSMSILLPSYQEAKPKKGEDRTDGSKALVVGSAVITKVHFDWAKKQLGRKMVVLHAGPMMPVACMVDDELRGMIMPCSDYPKLLPKLMATT